MHDYFLVFKYLVVPIIIIFPRTELKLLQDESMVLVGGCATPNFRTTTEIRGSQGNCCDYSFLLGQTGALETQYSTNFLNVQFARQHGNY